MKLNKILSIVVVALMLLMITSNLVLAYNPNSITGTTTGDGAAKIKSLGQNILGIIQVAGSVIAVAMLVILGVKYMMGSTEEKAEYKKTLIPYLVGAVFIFAASNLANAIYKWAMTL